jgi:XTP/dITP diphosphohydrolase
MKNISFLSSNANKAEELIALGRSAGIKIEWVMYEKLEVQNADPSEVVKKSAYIASQSFKKPFIMEDSGIFINALNGFPGAYASYVYSSIGLDGILKLLSKCKDRSAYFKTSILYSYSNKSRLFEGVSKGTIAQEISNTTGRKFGYDPIFIPDGQTRTFNEMDIKEKNLFSHRAIAFNKFAAFFNRQ